MAIIDMVALMAPNIDSIRYASSVANKVSEQEEFDKIKGAIQAAAEGGAEEVVFTEVLNDLYVQILKDAGYNVCIGTYNATSKMCTLIEWRYSFQWEEDTESGTTIIKKKTTSN